MGDQEKLIQEAKRYPLEFRSLSAYVKWFISALDTCGLSIDRSTLQIDRRGFPFKKPTRKGVVVIGTYHTIEAPARQTNGNLGIVIENRLNLRLREVIFVLQNKLYLSSYAYHFELINEQRYPYFRYEKRALPHVIEAYTPLFVDSQ